MSHECQVRVDASFIIKYFEIYLRIVRAPPCLAVLLGNFIDLFLDPPAGGKGPIRAHLAQHQILAENSAMGVDVM